MDLSEFQYLENECLEGSRVSLCTECFFIVNAHFQASFKSRIGVTAKLSDFSGERHHQEFADAESASLAFREFRALLFKKGEYYAYVELV